MKEYCKKALAMIGEFEEVEVITCVIPVKIIEENAPVLEAKPVVEEQTAEEPQPVAEERPVEDYATVASSCSILRNMHVVRAIVVCTNAIINPHTQHGIIHNEAVEEIQQLQQ